ncbi:MAG: type II secretion system protein [Patescibacteria group bacterium]
MTQPRGIREIGKKGFTLLELLIVIGIIAVLSVAIIFVLDPAETLRKSRDAQRMSDLATLKTALGIYVTSKTTPYLAGAASNTACKTNSGYASGDKVYYSYSSDSPGALITDTTLDGGTTDPSAGQVFNSSTSLTNATGWLPVNLDSLTGGSPISAMPTDPVNTIATPSAVVSTDLVYRYVCNSDTLKYEIDAQLESTAYTSDDNKRTKDGGNNSNYYEVGTGLNILGSGTDF